ncbi:RNA-directed DNA polymerase [Stenotrophomonas sp. WED208]|uniref:RNA-directed DNA polymerase n=1 Tax=Stenotrophomonas sp. WED208 TaxID=3112800 RepID=UPI002A9B4EE7|nr:RNA-directed DNA polymerase [Stenotrophomonas maltophilia]HEL3171576.1 RNA-directed DNA polymerase [Stenotrophomonas maltophilia]
MQIAKAAQLAVHNVLKEGPTDIFSRPFEIDLLKNENFAKEVMKNVESRLKSGSLSGLKTHPIQHVLFPKKDPFDFRRAALMQPMDTITYLALALTIADELETHRPQPAKHRVFSYRFKPKDGFLFNPAYNFTSFEQHVSNSVRRPKTKVLVKCDISSFYDRLNLHRLESTLLGLPLDKGPVKLINELLLFWANRDSYSLPIGGNASRILAEAALISVDDYLLSNGVNFCRFVDDYRFFAPDIESAHAWLTLFVERLFLEGLSINPAKTSIEDVASRRTSIAVVAPPTLPHNPKRDLGPARLIVGYTGIIPTKFRELSERESAELMHEDLDSILKQLKEKVVVLPDDIRRLLRILVAQSAFNKLSSLPEILNRFPQFTPLAVDLLIKKSGNVPSEVRDNLTKYFIGKTNISEKVPEYILIAVVRLLGAEGYQRKDALLDIFRNQKRNAGSYIGRCIIDAIHEPATRNDALEVRQYFNRADAWERRAIIRLVKSKLPEEETRPWLKNVRIHTADDHFAIESFEPKKK